MIAGETGQNRTRSVILFVFAHGDCALTLSLGALKQLLYLGDEY